MSIAKVCPPRTSSSQPPPEPLELRKGYFLHKEFRGLGGAGAKAQTTKVSGVPGSLPLGPGPAPRCGFTGTLISCWKLGQDQPTPAKNLSPTLVLVAQSPLTSLAEVKVLGTCLGHRTDSALTQGERHRQQTDKSYKIIQAWCGGTY